MGLFYSLERREDHLRAFVSGREPQHQASKQLSRLRPEQEFPSDPCSSHASVQLLVRLQQEEDSSNRPFQTKPT